MILDYQKQKRAANILQRLNPEIKIIAYNERLYNAKCINTYSMNMTLSLMAQIIFLQDI